MAGLKEFALRLAISLSLSPILPGYSTSVFDYEITKFSAPKKSRQIVLCDGNKM